MKISISRDVFFDGLQGVGSVIPQKPTLPVLSNFLLKAEKDSLSISGTDMDMFITTLIPCLVEEEGSITVNAKRFFSVIRELPSGEITIESEGERFTVTYCKGQSSILGISSSDYPSLRESLEGVKITLTGSDFIEMVDKSSFSIASDRTRPALTGVYWEISPERMIMASTDGHRLSLFEKQKKPSAEDSAVEGFDVHARQDDIISIIVPPKVLTHAMRVAMGVQEPGNLFFDVIFGKGAILFDFGKTRIFSKLIEGPYPDFRRVIPTDNSKRITVNTDEFSGSVRRVSVLSNTATHQIRMNLTPGKMEISTSNIDIGGESRETISVAYDGDPLAAGYNASFLSEILRVVDSEEIVLELESPIKACIIKPAIKRELREYLYLIMPLRLNE